MTYWNVEILYTENYKDPDPLRRKTLDFPPSASQKWETYAASKLYTRNFQKQCDTKNISYFP